MSRDDLEVVRIYFSLQGRVDRQLELLDQRIEWHVRPDLPDAGSYSGHHGFRKLAAGFDEAFDEESYEPLEFIDAGDHRVLVPLRWKGRGRLSGARFVQRSEAWLFTVDDGLIVTVVEFPGKAEALEAVGLRE